MIDARNWTIEEIVEQIKMYYKSIYKSGDMITDYYCGITNDLDRRKEEHCNNDFCIVENTLCSWMCSSAKVAAEVEMILGSEGFDIGNTTNIGNGAVEDTTIVYMLKKGKSV